MGEYFHSKVSRRDGCIVQGRGVQSSFLWNIFGVPGFPGLWVLPSLHDSMKHSQQAHLGVAREIPSCGSRGGCVGVARPRGLQIVCLTFA